MCILTLHSSTSSRVALEKRSNIKTNMTLVRTNIDTFFSLFFSCLYLLNFIFYCFVFILFILFCFVIFFSFFFFQAFADSLKGNKIHLRKLNLPEDLKELYAASHDGDNKSMLLYSYHYEFLIYLFYCYTFFYPLLSCDL